MATRREFNKPWKRIYGVDRRYTARVDRLRERRASPGIATGGHPIAVGEPALQLHETAFAPPGRSDSPMGNPPPVTNRIADSLAVETAP